jgi:uncharacterized integral membrane protein
VPDLSHLWQRFVLATALIFGLLLGVAATVFGYSNTASVNVSWSVFHLKGIPLWTVALVPLVAVLAAGTLYHWWNGLHHFTEHMRHRRRVRELEAEVTTLRAHLDQLLEMPDGSNSKPAARPVIADSVAVQAAPGPAAPALPEPSVANGGDKPKKARKRVALTSDAAPEPESTPATREDLPENGEAEHA